ncbi:MAG: ferredoxin [Candidatus Gracilibacteria bacterium]|nr:ferredoxin [Candidatus Gracilibacteria bacterium]
MADIKVKVDKNKCIGCGTCTIMCDAFKIDDDMKAEYIEENDASEEEIEAAVGSCPVGALSKE